MPYSLMIFFRTISLFLLTLLLVRILGKRQPARMTPFTYVSYTVFALIVTFMLLGSPIQFIGGLIALVSWAALFFSLEYLSMKSKWVHDWVMGKETILVKQGKIMEDNLGQVRLTGEELLRELRSKGAFNLADVEFAIMESTGDLNVLMKSDKTPVTAHDLGKKVSPKSEPETVILDGNIIDESLANMGLNRKWLDNQLAAKGITVDNVFLGQVDSSGDLYLDLFNDAIQMPQSKVKELIYHNLKKSQADLTGYALGTENQETKSVYAANAEKLDGVIEKLEPFLIR